MGVRFIYGKTGSGKSEYCFSEISEKIKTEKKIYMITPEQFSFTAESKLMKAVNSHAVINAEVLTLSRMAYRVLIEVGGSSKTQLSKCGKSMLIYSILNRYKKDLKFLGKSDENIDLAMNQITEFKKHGISHQNLNNEKEKTKDSYLKAKIEDMSLVYEKFEEHIKGKYIEDTDLLNLLAENIDKTDIVKNSIIYLDEFSGFTKQEYDVLKKFIELAKQVNITICTDNLEDSTNPDIDIYYSNKKTVSKIINIVKENDFKLEKPIQLESQHRFKTDELQYLAQNLNQIKPTIYAKNVDNIHLFLAKNQYSEIENVAKEIIKLVKEKNLRYRDIAIISKNVNDYSSLVRTIFASYNIPVFIDEKRDLNQNIIIQYILSILEILSKNFTSEAIFNYLKIGFLDIEQDETFKLENYCTKWGITQNKWKKDFIYEIEKEDKKNEIERLNELRRKIILPLVQLKEEMSKEKTAENITKCLYKFLKSQNIEEKIIEKVKELEELNLIDIANEYVTSYKVFLDVLDEIILVFKNEKTNIDKYSKILKVGFQNSELGKIPATQDQVILGDVERSKTHQVKAVFIIGVNDGVFPSINNEEGFFNDEDRKKLKEDGIELANGTIDNLYEEKFNIYKAFTTAENYLFISYPSSDREGKSLRPATMLNKLKKIFPKLKEESNIIEKSHEIINQVIDYTNLPGEIKKENIEKLYGNILSTSISRLEKYRSCPFSYYLQYGLKLKEKEELKIHTFDTGSFMHETIDEFFEQVREQKLGLAEIEEEQIYEIVSEIIDKNLQLSKNFIFNTTAKYKSLVKRLKRIVSKALKYIIQTIIYSDFRVEGTEVEFGKKGTYKPIVLTLEDGKRVEITGKIDRIDTAERRRWKIFKNYRL